ncbi:putative protein shisa-5-like [Brachionus plicatilis]|uniref:Shisa N-terminal domain-containing protein n=1 Tax=Brachionus plicatilis TaxID=10195 RepID=A0A3M7Q3S1_BRAPC|nr:putative protein shisa-5-like [Brachionus plicatilis]
MSILFRVSSIKDSDESSSHETQSRTSKCIAYVDKYGFLKEEKSCNKYCCGGCHNRYCCSTKKEAMKNQKNCLNNFNSSNIGLGPVKDKICLAYFDNNDKLLPEKTCENGYFCSGTCSRRFCGNKDYDWLDQIQCRNGFNSTNTTMQTTTKFGHLKVDKLFYFIGFGLATFGFLLIAYKLMTNLFEKEMKINSSIICVKLITT